MFISTIGESSSLMEKLIVETQEAVRKNIERAFGVFRLCHNDA